MFSRSEIDITRMYTFFTRVLGSEAGRGRSDPRYGDVRNIDLMHRAAFILVYEGV